MKEMMLLKQGGEIIYMPVKTVHKAGGILIQDDCIYIVYRAKMDDYTLPKGHIDPGETPEIAAIRGMKEETGFDVAINTLCCESMYEHTHGDMLIQCVVSFYLTHRTGDIVHPLADDVDRVIKVPLKDIYTTLSYQNNHEVVKKALEMYKI